MYTDYTEENNNDSYYSDQGNNTNKEKIKKIVFFVLIFVVLVVLIIILAKGCSKGKEDGGSLSENTPTPSIAINNQTLSLEVGESFQLYADVLMASSSDPNVLWLSEDSSIVAVNDDGYVTAISEGTTNIVASYRENGRSYSNKCSVVVTSKAYEIESISIAQKDVVMLKGKSILLQIAITPKEAKAENLVFTSDDTSIATVSEEGYVNAVEVGTTTITVKTEDGSISDSTTITVTDNGPTTIHPTGLQLLGLSNGLSVGSKAEIFTIITPSNATNKDLTWQSSNPSVATVNNGIVTGISPGTTTIMATTANNISAKLEVTVASNTVAVTGITINGATSIQMQTGGTRLLTYTISPSNATNKKVTYTTSNANVVLVDSNGILAAVGSGNAVVTITTVDGKKTAIANITVTGSSNTTTPSGSGGGSGTSYDPSSGTSSQGGSTTTSPGSSTVSSSESSSCTSYGMVQISHNEPGAAVISSISFDNAKAFTNKSETPTITIKDFLDCLSYANYYVYYGTSKTSVSGTSSLTGTIHGVGDTIKLLKGNGYYKILVKGYNKNTNSYLLKYYYAIVNNGSTSGTTVTTTPTIKLSVTSYNSNTKQAYVKFETTGSGGIHQIKYCVATPTGTCVPSTTIAANGKSIFETTRTISNVPVGYKVCAVAYDKGGKTSPKICTLSTATKDSLAPAITFTKGTAGSSTIPITLTVIESGSGLKQIEYCTKIIKQGDSSSCTPNYKLTTFTQSGNKYQKTVYPLKSNVSSGYKLRICAKATDKAGNTSSVRCYDAYTR